MPYRPNPRRRLPIQLNALQLTGSIALGLWLGFLAIALTCWLASRLLFSEQLAPVAQAVEQLAKPPVVAQPVPDTPPQSPLFDQLLALGGLIAIAMPVYFGIAFAIGGADLGMIRRNLKRKPKQAAAKDTMAGEGDQQ